MDDRQSDQRSSPSEENEDQEYELESPETVVSGQERHAKQVLESTKDSIDFDEIYREAERERGGEILEQWLRNFRFRFQLKHLLIGTAVLAIALTLSKLGLLWPTLIILLMLSIFSLYMYLKWEERKQQAEATLKRQEFYARRREKLRANDTTLASEEQNQPVEIVPIAAPSPPTKVDETWQEAPARERVRFRFSLRELLIAMTTAAVILGMMRLFGGPASTATVLGFVALNGLIIHALGFEPPQMVILGWWFILVMYVLLSIFAAVWRGLA